jgi:putative membrane protein
MFQQYKQGTLALLTGFIIGSIPKIWPWKKVLETRQFGDKILTVKEANIMPWDYDGNSQIFGAILLALIGFSLIFALEGLAKKRNTAS